MHLPFSNEAKKVAATQVWDGCPSILAGDRPVKLDGRGVWLWAWLRYVTPNQCLRCPMCAVVVLSDGRV